MNTNTIPTPVFVFLVVAGTGLVVMTVPGLIVTGLVYAGRAHRARNARRQP